jgi:chromate transporter
LSNPRSASAGSALEVFRAALRLGVTSFGGPIAHLGYFEQTYVRARHWLSAQEYGDLISLCQLLPGPSSSQVGFLIGLHRAGWAGALAAWAGFTLPSALLMYGFALLAPTLGGARMQAFLHGLMLTAVVVVAQAVWAMARTLAADLRRRAIAISACILLLLQHSAAAQLATLMGGALAGAALCRSRPSAAARAASGIGERRGAWIALASFVVVLAGSSAATLWHCHGPVALASLFYRSGALVFGGGHVVLPLLQQALVPQWLSVDRFLAGYGFAQAMPGPLFTFAAYLGAASAPPGEAPLWALCALTAIFLPGLLLAASGQSLWKRISSHANASAALAGINAAVVGVLAAALYDPVWTSAVHALPDVISVIIAFIFIQMFRTPPIFIAALCVAMSMLEKLLA